MICKECWINKKLEEFYRHPLTKNWRMGRCKECVKKWRSSEEERIKARIYDNKRSKTEKRRKYNTEHCKKYRVDNREKYLAQRLVWNFFRYKRKHLRPKECSHCNCDKNIELHHEDYLKPNQVIPLCSLCHSQHHIWKIQINKNNEIDIYSLK